MRTRQGRSYLAIAAFAGLSGACYTYQYQPLAAPAPRPGVEVRAELSTPIRVQIGEMTLNDVSLVEGQVYYAQGDSVMVWGQWIYTRGGTRFSANGGSLYLDRQHVGTLQVRRLSAVRSGVAGAVTVGLVVALFQLVESALGGGGSGGPPIDPN